MLFPAHRIECSRLSSGEYCVRFQLGISRKAVAQGPSQTALAASAANRKSGSTSVGV